MPDDARTKAQEALQVAVENHIRAFRSAPENGDIEITGDWILVASVTSLDLVDNDRRYAYHLAFSTGEQAEHVAYGLLHVAGDLLAGGGQDG